MRKLFLLAIVLIGFGLVFVLAVNPISPRMLEQLQFWSTGIGAGVTFLIVVMIILSFFLPFFVYGIYNQSKEINNNLKRLNQNLLNLSIRIEHLGSTTQQLLADALDKGTSSSGKRIS